MLWKLILLLTLVPIVELVLLVKLTQWWDSLTLTIGIIIGTGLLGAVLARSEGLRVVRQMREQLARAELPADSLIDGVMILVAAALLLTPGLLTDACGFLLLIPPSRAIVRRMLKAWMKSRFQIHRIGIHYGGDFGPIEDEPPPGAPPLEDEETP
ncbi:MAG: FxsA family protein [Planctomycetota bacterium]|jgi:UPF0716 protein FxsA